MATCFRPQSVHILSSAEQYENKNRETAAKSPGAATPGGCTRRLRYHRWHGAPRVYWATYDDAWLDRQAAALRALPGDAACWGSFDNTASGGALQNALQLQARR